MLNFVETKLNKQSFHNITFFIQQEKFYIIFIQLFHIFLKPLILKLLHQKTA